MRTNRLFYGLILLISGFAVISCVEKYSPDIKDYSDQLVVDGLITNQNGPYKVLLSKTSPLNNDELRPFTGASVLVEDNEGNTYEFDEVVPGSYENNEFTGEPGVAYKLQILASDGKLYESDYQEMPPSVPIDTVYAEIETNPTENPDYNEIGYQFYLSSQDVESESIYFLWKLTETYEYHADHDLEYTYSGVVVPYPDPDEFSTCWKTTKLREFYLFDASVLNNVNIQNLPLNFVNTETKRLSVRYSLLVDQYILSEQAFEFFSSVQEMNSGNDLFYSTQPYQIEGNVECVDEPQENVLGQFLVAGKTSKRIFVDRPYGVYFYYEVCPVNTEEIGELGMYHPSDYPIYLTLTENMVMGTVGKGCVDCREHGGTIEKPDFW